MVDWRWTIVVIVGCFAASLAGTRLVLGLLRRRAILDHPNERSSHVVPTPRGGGIAPVAALLVAWLLIALAVPAPIVAGAGEPGPLPQTAWPVIAAIALALVSWYDDVASAPILLRLLIQAAAVVVGLESLSGHGLVFQGLLPPFFDRAVTGFLWLWFVNLFNFMDGIDGITGTETAALGFGAALIAMLCGLGGDLVLDGLGLAAAALGFLWWNWSPAKVFLGDVGSVPFGYLAGWLLIETSCRGAWAPALILPLYYLADASLTLLRRILRRERVWRAHREHFYQRAVQGGLSHARAVLEIAGLDIVLIGLAVWAAAAMAARALPWAPLLAAALATAALLARFRRAGGA